MHIRHLALLLVVVTALGCSHGGPQAWNRPIAGCQDSLDPHAVVAIYLKAVDRGELTVLDRRFDRSMITPTRVEYAFGLDSPIPIVKVYSELRQTMAVPNQEDCEVRGVSAIIDAAGKIVETAAHIWQRERVRTKC
jgi:hypothetical protein